MIMWVFIYFLYSFHLKPSLQPRENRHYDTQCKQPNNCQNPRLTGKQHTQHSVIRCGHPASVIYNLERGKIIILLFSQIENHNSHPP